MHCTDLFSQVDGLRWAAGNSEGRPTFSEEHVDATSVPDTPRGPRTPFNAFHHCRPCVVRQTLEGTVSARQPIGVFEFVRRQPHALLPTLRPVR